MSDYEGLGEGVPPEEVTTVGEAILRWAASLPDCGEITLSFTPGEDTYGIPWDE